MFFNTSTVYKNEGNEVWYIVRQGPTGHLDFWKYGEFFAIEIKNGQPIADGEIAKVYLDRVRKHTPGAKLVSCKLNTIATYSLGNAENV